ncbi:MAG TPA: hypothetical protein VIM56_03780 [Rhizomicrobium sp.]
MNPYPFYMDGGVLMLIALLFLVLAHTDYRTDPWWARVPLYFVVFFAFCSAVHLFGLRIPSWAKPYWASIGFHVSIMLAIICKLFVGKFFPKPPVRLAGPALTSVEPPPASP